jgi:uncharacterized protein YehS (DUF1456 family)
MTNNDTLRRLRYAFDFGDDEMIAVFGLGDRVVTRAEVSDWLKKDDDPASRTCDDAALASFLNGLIIHRRGRRDGPARPAETSLTNNLVLTKLKIAMAYSGDDVMELMRSAGHQMSKHELSALFRKPGHKHYRECLDQVLRNFLKGLLLRLRPDASAPED